MYFFMFDLDLPHKRSKKPQSYIIFLSNKPFLTLAVFLSAGRWRALGAAVWVPPTSRRPPTAFRASSTT